MLVAIAAALQLVPHQPNFTATLAVALFAGAYLGGTLGTFVAFAPMAIVNAVWVFHNPGYAKSVGAIMGFDYAAVILVMVVGMALTVHKRKIGGRKAIPASLIGATVGSVVFFLVSNFGVWVASGMYPMTWSGLVVCYVAAIPFFGNTILSTAAFSFIFFASYEVALKAIRGHHLQKGIVLN